MGIVSDKTEELIRAMRDSEDYQQYSRLETLLKENTELRERINAYRMRNYEMQNSGRDLFDETDYVIHEYESLMHDPVAAAYLDAENAVCRMIQRVIDAINREVPVEHPNG